MEVIVCILSFCVWYALWFIARHNIEEVEKHLFDQ